MANFEDTYRSAYGFDTPGIDIGNVMKDGTPTATLPVRIPLGMMNRHGLIAGSTGTGKTRTLQLLAEGLSRNGVPVFLADVKGDLAGMDRSRERARDPHEEDQRRGERHGGGRSGTAARGRPHAR